MRISRRLPLAVGVSWFAFLLLCRPAASNAQTSQNILLVINSASATSEQIGTYYSQKRSVPAAQVLRLKLPVTEEVTRAVYVQQIESPIASWFAQHNAYDRILYVVLAKDVPLRIAGTAGTTGTVASVDSELALLYRRMVGVTIVPAGPIANPYFLGDQPVSSLRPFTHREQDVYLVTRLDGFAATDVERLIDRGLAPAQQPGRILLNTRRDVGGAEGNKWLETAAVRLKAQKGWADHTLVTKVFQVPTDKPLYGYYSWGSNDPARLLSPESHFSFLPGALAAMFVSTDARTFKSPPQDWRPGKQFAGSPQSLIGELIRDGVTGVAGHVAEPFLITTIRPEVLFPAYARGLNLAESFYAAMPTMSWQTVVVGDPLCAPFRTQSIGDGDLDPGADAVTGLSIFFSDRRVRLITALGASRDGARYFIKAELQGEVHDTAGAIRSLEAATKADSRFVAAQLSLASLLDSAGRVDASIERYRVVLKLTPNNITALNNLAFTLAVKGKAPAQALPLAQRAYARAKTSPTVMDTLGWIHHLLGNNREAEPLLLAASKRAASNAEILLHTAVVLAANGKRQEAADMLKRAETVDPALDRGEDARRLRELLQPTRQ